MSEHPKEVVKGFAPSVRLGDPPMSRLAVVFKDSFNQNPVYGLISTATHPSIITLDIIEKLQLPYTVDSGKVFELQTAFDKVTYPYKYGNFNIRIGNKDYVQKLVIIDSKFTDFIIGTDLISATNWIGTLDPRTVSITHADSFKNLSNVYKIN